MAVLLIADHDQGALSPATARAVGALAALDGEIEVLVAGHGIDAVARDAAALEGVSRVHAADDQAFAHGDAAALTTLLQPLAERFTHIAAIAGALGRDVIPRLAAKRDTSPVTDVIAIHDATRFERPIYAGNAIETVTASGAPVLMTLRASAFAPVKTQAPAPVAPLPLTPVAALARFVSEERTQLDTPDLAVARIVVAGGVSLGSADNFKMIEKLAATLGAAVGATRDAVDAGYAPNDWQIGQTGKVIAPDLYIAVGVSGALQHLAGIQGAKTIIAINADPEAPLARMADYALIGDLFEIVPTLTAALAR